MRRQQSGKIENIALFSVSLVVKDDKKIASFVVKGLKQNGFTSDHAAAGEEGLFMAQSVN